MNVKSIVSDVCDQVGAECDPQLVRVVVDALADALYQDGKIADILISHGRRRLRRVRNKRKL